MHQILVIYVRIIKKIEAKARQSKGDETQRKKRRLDVSFNNVLQNKT